MNLKLTRQLAKRIASLGVLLPEKMREPILRGNVLVVFDLGKRKQVDVVTPDNTTKGLARELARLKRSQRKAGS